MKTWKDLKHGDVITSPRFRDSRTIIDVLPNSVFLQGNATVFSYWMSIQELEKLGWQIVQPEEEYIIEREIFFDPNCKKPEVELYHGVWRVRVYRKRSI